MPINRKKLAFITFPLSLIYGMITEIRNLLFDKGIFKQHSFTIPVISVGNITVGGTGKTPHVEYLVKLLEKSHRVAVLSRGYKRKTNDFTIASVNSDVTEIGDEPKQVKRKFPDVSVAVSNKRVEGVKKLLLNFPETEVVILDDAFQHRYIKPGLSILLIDYNRPVISDYLLPYGDLREHRNGIKRADIIIVTKTPHGIIPSEQDNITEGFNLLPNQSLFFSSFYYGKPVPVFSESAAGIDLDYLKSDQTGILIVTGIAYPKPLHDYLNKMNTAIETLQFSDHHNYSLRDIKKITGSLDKLRTRRKVIVTTEKDAMRLVEVTGLDVSLKQIMYFIPLEVEFRNNTAEDFKKKLTYFLKPASAKIKNKVPKHKPA